jgi:two-component system OmpR family response regulator
MSGVRSAVVAAPVVLVVDDTAGVRDVLCAGFRLHGFEVWTASDGREAIEYFNELRQPDHDAPAIVLLDIQMPGLDGPTVLAALRTIDPNVPAFFMTGDPGEYDEAELLAMGARRVFAKPLDIAAVANEFRGSLATVGVGSNGHAGAHPSN